MIKTRLFLYTYYLYSYTSKSLSSFGEGYILFAKRDGERGVKSDDGQAQIAGARISSMRNSRMCVRVIIISRCAIFTVHYDQQSHMCVYIYIYTYNAPRADYRSALYYIYAPGVYKYIVAKGKSSSVSA